MVPIRSSRLAGRREHIYECLVLLYLYRCIYIKWSIQRVTFDTKFCNLNMIYRTESFSVNIKDIFYECNSILHRIFLIFLSKWATKKMLFTNHKLYRFKKISKWTEVCGKGLISGWSKEYRPFFFYLLLLLD